MSNFSPNVEVNERENSSLFCTLKNTAAGGHIQQHRYIKLFGSDAGDAPRPPVDKQYPVHQTDHIKGAERKTSVPQKQSVADCSAKTRTAPNDTSAQPQPHAMGAVTEELGEGEIPMRACATFIVAVTTGPPMFAAHAKQSRFALREVVSNRSKRKRRTSSIFMSDTMAAGVSNGTSAAIHVP